MSQIISIKFLTYLAPISIMHADDHDHEDDAEEQKDFKEQAMIRMATIAKKR